ncbi:MAG: hypothetical protein A3K19_03650 [Lentisphaerae bacterium RIFOXYB12_FULL_65_16]|nr:MAG: hypothetical protein A3K18_30060 [Lentisphaerae bacterium RIFOXYA12_64_32]OGV86607.1 MAG: hypothetical protein A3K19_03650 [Lentisphaerae bacterium RIFOXYB12_FULL_65_16]
MNLVPVNALKSPRRLRERLLQEHELIVTNNGRPMALMVEVRQGEDPEVPLRAFREVRSRLALSAVRRAAAEHGTDRLGLTEINDVIAAVRADREPDRGGKRSPLSIPTSWFDAAVTAQHDRAVRRPGADDALPMASIAALRSSLPGVIFDARDRCRRERPGDSAALETTLKLRGHSEMNARTLRECCTVRPFKPFVINLSDGRSFPIPHPDFLLIPPAGDIVIACHQDGAVNLISLDQITDVAIDAVPGRRPRRAAPAR